jgi:lipopolysaccharide/colanic/teichoic acid biosynthesis glycosyltransferase
MTICWHSERPTLLKVPPRALDIALALTALLVLSPVLLCVALLLLVTSGRPVFFRQERIGRNGRIFSILKFRTMRAGEGGPQITAAGDQRVTRTGAWLRKLKIDELPQFWNVLRGEMSVIGPRPEVPAYVHLEDQLWRDVLEYRPGITDLATLAFRDEEDLLRQSPDPDDYYRGVVLPAKLRLNVQYQRSRSLRRDLKLLWFTARYSFLPRGFSRDRILGSFGAYEPLPADKHALSAVFS